MAREGSPGEQAAREAAESEEREVREEAVESEEREAREEVEAAVEEAESAETGREAVPSHKEEAAAAAATPAAAPTPSTGPDNVSGESDAGECGALLVWALPLLLLLLLSSWKLKEAVAWRCGASSPSGGCPKAPAP